MHSDQRVNQYMIVKDNSSYMLWLIKNWSNELNNSSYMLWLVKNLSDVVIVFLNRLSYRILSKRLCTHNITIMGNCFYKFPYTWMLRVHAWMLLVLIMLIWFNYDLGNSNYMLWLIKNWSNVVRQLKWYVMITKKFI